ncbi:MAG TPA: LysM peptidoglycan-binding domain-containing protein, partial [Flavobacteriaceae bacterium]|nr:LysM peptidoglycan-binding domain-containing protein [Flavobacteriaceae bacterium]
MKQVLLILGLLVSMTLSARAQNYQTHKVKKGETIEAIAKRYLVTPYEIYQLNPDAKKELRVNSVLIIPKSKVETAEKAVITKELKGFKEHKVKRKETLFSLAKEYDVEVEDIKKHNPHLYAENLRKGEEIKIPVFTKTLTVEKPKSTTKPYQVQPKEGKWRIAYKFGITVDELESLNPEMGEVLKEGEIIQVPNKELSEVKEIDEKYSYYTVLPKEGFYRLKLKLGLEQEQLEALNPGLKETGLKQGMVLKIPFNSSMETSTEDTPATNLETQIDSDTGTKHIVVMLPFRLNRVDTDSLFDTKRQIVRDPYLSNSLDFHSGVLMAMDSLKKLGISIKLDVYDTKNEKSEISRILQSRDFGTVDAVIGPLLNDNFELVASELKSANVPVVSPLGKGVQLYGNVFQSRPDDEVLKTKMFEYVKTHSEGANIVVIADSKNAALSSEIKREFASAAQVNSRKGKSGNDLNYVTVADLANVIKPGKNIVFLETESAGLASNATSILNSLLNAGTEIMLVTTNMNKAFEGDEVSNYDLSNLKFHFTTVARDYNDEVANGFIAASKKQYKDTPSKMATRGFDLTMDVVLRLATSSSLYTSVNEA